jgi:hypothetical protein
MDLGAPSHEGGVLPLLHNFRLAQRQQIFPNRDILDRISVKLFMNLCIVFKNKPVKDFWLEENARVRAFNAGEEETFGLYGSSWHDDL